MFTVARKSFKGDMLQLQEGDNKPKWYFLDSKVSKFAGTIEKGDAVSIKTEERGKDSYITYITKEGAQGASAPAPAHSGSSGNSYSYKKTTSSYGKSPEESERIARLSVMSTAVNMLAHRTDISLENVANEVINLYETLLAKIGEGLLSLVKEE